MNWYDNATLMKFRLGPWNSCLEDKISRAEARARRADLEARFENLTQPTEEACKPPCPAKRTNIS